MSDRLQEIRARLDAAQLEMVRSLMFGKAEDTAALAFISAAPNDILWLLDEVHRLTTAMTGWRDIAVKRYEELERLRSERDA